MNQLTDIKLDAIRLKLLATVLELQQYTSTAANVIPILGSERVIAIGTAAEVAGLVKQEHAGAAPSADFATWLKQHPELRGFTIGAKGGLVWIAAQQARAPAAQAIDARSESASMTMDEAIDLLRDALEHYNHLAPNTITAREALRLTANITDSGSVAADAAVPLDVLHRALDRAGIHVARTLVDECFTDEWGKAGAAPAAAAGDVRDAARARDHNSQNPDCSCPSGNGSLRWPCPVHPPERAAIFQQTSQGDKA
jgi:hypothetical protein